MRSFRALSKVFTNTERRDSQVDHGAGVSSSTSLAVVPSAPTGPAELETECPICFEPLGENRITCSPCNHSACKDCTKANCEYLIKNGSPSISCVHPKCPSYMSHYQILELFQSDEAMIEKYEKFSVEKALLQMDNVARCPRPGCSLAVIVCPDSNEVECAACRNLFCPKCQLESHPGVSCKTFKKWSVSGQTREEKMFRRWKNKTENVKKCPKCKIVIHKISGCNMMSCSQCKHNFCWLCGGSSSSAHFNSLNPFGCAGQQHSDSSNIGKRVAIRVGLGLGYLVGVPVALAAAPVIGIPYGCVMFGKKIRNYFRRKKQAKKRQRTHRQRAHRFSLTEDTVITGPHAFSSEASIGRSPPPISERSSISLTSTGIAHLFEATADEREDSESDNESTTSADSGTESSNDFDEAEAEGDAHQEQSEYKDLQTTKRILDMHYAQSAQSLNQGSTGAREADSAMRDKYEIYSDNVSVLQELFELVEQSRVCGSDGVHGRHSVFSADVAVA